MGSAGSSWPYRFFSAVLLLFTFFSARSTCLADAEKRWGEVEGYEQASKILQQGRQQKSAGKRPLRARTLAHSAHVFGFQQAFQWKYGQIMAEVDAHAQDFAEIFNFRRLLLEERIVPPVIHRAGPADTLIAENTMQELELEYRIVSPARLCSSPPDYMAYLFADMAVVTPPERERPGNSEERRIWEEEFYLGWKEGIAHAREVFELNLQTMLSDFRGMLLYLRLKAEGLVHGPVLEKGRIGIQVGERVLTMNGQVFRLTVPASFLPQPEQKKTKGEK